MGLTAAGPKVHVGTNALEVGPPKNEGRLWDSKMRGVPKKIFGGVALENNSVERFLARRAGALVLCYS
jgi:hypothetical protein